MSTLVIMSSKVILLYHIQTKTLLLNLLFKYSNQTQILLLKDLFLKNFLLKYILSKVKPNGALIMCTFGGLGFSLSLLLLFFLKLMSKISNWCSKEI